MRHFSEPIYETAVRVPELQAIMERYARGEIITREEALSQMVMALARKAEHADLELLERIKLMGPGPFIK